MDRNIFIQQARDKHGDKYDYTLIDHDPTHKDKINIICPQHGIFIQNTNSHLLRSGCPDCSRMAHALARRKQKNYYISKANCAHNYKYQYDLVPDIPKATDKVTITCPKHGNFTQQLSEHIRGHGCSKCAREAATKKMQKGKKHFLARCCSIHDNKYQYDFSDEVKIKDAVTITCPDHGTFTQVLDSHLSGSGCPKCSRDTHTSKPEQEIIQLLHQYNITDCVSNDRTTISPKELDILIPSHNVAIEYCGLYWHSETRGKTKYYHQAKMNECGQQGIRLCTIFEDEWLHRKPQVIRKLKNILHVSDEKRTYARQCTIVDVDTKHKQKFLDDHHIQGTALSSINIGLQHNNSLVAVMSFTRSNHNYCLTRYATSCLVVGGFSRLLNYFQKTHEWKRIVSFADLRWSTGDVYAKTGWTLEDIIPPDYSYIQGTNRIHKFNYRRKYLSKRLNTFDPTLTEKENCDANGVLRIWDCGKQRWILENSD